MNKIGEIFTDGQKTFLMRNPKKSFFKTVSTEVEAKRQKKKWESKNPDFEFYMKKHPTGGYMVAGFKKNPSWKKLEELSDGSIEYGRKFENSEYRAIINFPAYGEKDYTLMISLLIGNQYHKMYKAVESNFKDAYRIMQTWYPGKK